MPIAILRRTDTNANWNSNNPVIPSRQLAFTINAGEFNTPLIKFGNGSSNWADLPYINRKNNLTATTDPATSDNASTFYSVGSLWLNTSSSNQQLFVLNNFSGANAIWLPIGEVIRNLSQIQDVPAYPNDGYIYNLTEENGVLSWEIAASGGGAVDSVNGQTGVVVLTLENLNDVPAYPNDGYDYVLVENNGTLTWELFSSTGLQTLAEVLTQGNTTGGTDIVITDGDKVDFSAASGGTTMMSLPSGGAVEHQAIGAIKWKTLEVNFHTLADLLVYAFNANGNFEVGSVDVDGSITIYDSSSNFSVTINTPNITADRSITYPDGNIVWTAAGSEDNYVMTYDFSSNQWRAEAVPSAPVQSVNGATGTVVLDLEDINDVPAYPNDGYDYVLVENSGVLTWEPFASGGGITESELINTQRAFAKAQWLEVTALTPVSDVFTANLETTSGSYTADIGANSTFANPVIPSGYSTGKVLAWDVTCTFTGAGGWTIGFGSQYRVDDGVDLAAIIAANNATGDVIQFFFQYKNGIVRVQPFVDTVIPAP